MYIWLILIGGSALIGFLTATLLKKRWAMYVAGAVPWFSILAALMYSEYFTEYEGGGASMWLIGQLFGGSVAAVVGVVSYKLTTLMLKGNASSL